MSTEEYSGTYTVTLELPDCEWNPAETGEPNDPIGAVRSFQAQASQVDLFAYIVKQEDAPHRTFLVDMSDSSVKEIDRIGADDPDGLAAERGQRPHFDNDGNEVDR